MLNMLMIFLSRSPDEESEEEILEGSPPDPEQQQQPGQTTSHDNTGQVDPEEENTDDEIERVMNANKAFTDNNDKTSPKNGGRSSKSGNCLYL